MWDESSYYSVLCVLRIIKKIHLSRKRVKTWSKQTNFYFKNGNWEFHLRYRWNCLDDCKLVTMWSHLIFLKRSFDAFFSLPANMKLIKIPSTYSFRPVLHPVEISWIWKNKAKYFNLTDTNLLKIHPNTRKARQV